MAVATADIQALRSLQASLNTAMDSYITSLESRQTEVKAPASQRVADAANNIISAMREPFGEAARFPLHPTQNLVVRIAIDLDLFNRIGDETTLDQLVERTKADKVLLLRMLRLLVSSRFFTQPKPFSYSSTPLSMQMRNPVIRDLNKMYFDTLLPIWAHTPEFLRKNGFKDINDLSNNPTLDLYGANFFEELAADPRREADFASAMKVQELIPPAARPKFPFTAPSVLQDFTNESQRSGGSDVYFVDVGGGQGQYMSSLIKQYPDLPGRKILQDLPTVIADLKTKELSANEGFEAMGHDFFTSQPVRGAKYYHLRGILHDWPDSSCLQILDQLRPAFKPEYSRLLIQSYILPETGCSSREAMLDINMWTCCGIERTESQWRELLKKADFEILDIVRAEVGPYGIIEARVAEDRSSRERL